MIAFGKGVGVLGGGHAARRLDHGSPIGQVNHSQSSLTPLIEKARNSNELWALTKIQ